MLTGSGSDSLHTVQQECGAESQVHGRWLPESQAIFNLPNLVLETDSLLLTWTTDNSKFSPRVQVQQILLIHLTILKQSGSITTSDIARLQRDLLLSINSSTQLHKEFKSIILFMES